MSDKLNWEYFINNLYPSQYSQEIIISHPGAQGAEEFVKFKVHLFHRVIVLFILRENVVALTIPSLQDAIKPWHREFTADQTRQYFENSLEFLDATYEKIKRNFADSIHYNDFIIMSQDDEKKIKYLSFQFCLKSEASTLYLANWLRSISPQDMMSFDRVKELLAKVDVKH